VERANRIAEEDLGGETAVERANRIAEKDREERRENKEERREERRDRRDDVRHEIRDEREDYWDDVHDDHEDWYDDHYGHGTVRVYTSLPCTGEAVVVDGVTYYRCSSTWYTRTFSRGDVTYAVVDAPAGY
jgi:hypothetical protein